MGRKKGRREEGREERKEGKKRMAVKGVSEGSEGR